MDDCPTRHQLEQILAEPTSEPSGELLRQHIRSCARCQSQLDALTDDVELKVWLASSGGQNTNDARDDSAIARVLASALPPPDRAEVFVPPTAGIPSTEFDASRGGASAESTSAYATVAGNDPPGIEDLADLSFLSPPIVPGTLGRLDQFDVLEVIGQGGFGIVLKARDNDLQRIAAVKVLLPELARRSGTARKRFIREARAAAAVSHDHVIGIFAVAAEKVPPYLVMEFVNGRSLQEKLDQDGPFELAEVLRIGMQVAEGLAAAHKQGLVHRDIKPANILLENGVERVKITDFGLARAADDAGVTQTGVVAGTPQYMAPEQARGEALDPRSDLFSLGSVLYALCTGHPPFRAQNTVATLKRVCEDEPRPIREIRPEIPDALVEIIQQLHAKAAPDRIQTATEVAQLLAEQLARLQHSALTAPRPRSKPRRPQFGAVAAVVFLLIAGSLLAFALNRRAGRSKPPDVTIGNGARATTSTPKDDDPPNAAAKLTAATSAVLHTADWPLGPGDEQFPGLVPRPTVIPGAHRWQLASRFPRSMLENVAWAPDGKQVACCGLDELIRVYDVKTLQLVRAWPAKSVKSLDWSRDGKFIASGSYERMLHAWNADDGSPRWNREGHEGVGQIIHSVAISPDSQLIASASQADRSVRLWKSTNGEPDRVFLHPQPAWDVAWSPDGTRLATACEDTNVRVWNPFTGTTEQLLSGHTVPVRSLAFSADGKRLVTTDAAGKIRVWDLDRQKEERAWDGGGTSVAVSRLGEVAAVNFASPDIPLWELSSGARGPKCRGHDYQYQGRHCIRFSPDGLSLASVNEDGSLKIWNPKTGQCTGTVAAHSHEHVQLSFDAEGKTLAAAGNLVDAARLWNVADGSLRLILKPPGCRFVRRVAFSPDGREIVTCGGDAPVWDPEFAGKEDHSLRFWSCEDGTPGPVYSGHTGKVTALAYSPDGRRVASGGWDAHIRVWDRMTGSTERMLQTPNSPITLAFSPNGSHLGSVFWEDSLRTWDMATGAIGATVQLKRGDGFECLAFHPLGKEVATAEYSHVRIRDAAQGTVIRDAIARHAMSVAISPDGRLLAAGDDRFLIQLCNYNTGLLFKELHGHFGNCRALGFSPDSRLLASGSADGSIRLWDTQTGMPLRVTLPLLGDRCATITSAGKLQMDPAAAEEEMIYIIQQRENGPVKILTPREFQGRFREALPNSAE